MKKISKLNEALNKFNIARQILKEDYGIGPEEEMPALDGNGEISINQEQSDIANYRGDNEHVQHPAQEENTDMDLSKSDERIAHIREIALGGLQDYAQDVDCEAYQFYKKIWLMCDKAVSEKESASNGGSAA